MSRRKNRTSIGKRALPLCAGIVVAGLGLLELKGGRIVLVHWTGQPLYSAGLVAMGVLLIVFAFLPNSWVARIARIRGQRR
jgi:hypothetical protein